MALSARVFHLSFNSTRYSASPLLILQLHTIAAKKFTNTSCSALEPLHTHAHTEWGTEKTGNTHVTCVPSPSLQHYLHNVSLGKKQACW